MHKFTVKRSKWLRGGRDGNNKRAMSVLKNTEGHKCCLGFYLESIGYKRKLVGKDTPYMCQFLSKPAKWLLKTKSGAYGELNQRQFFVENDAWGVGEKYREKNLTKLFAEHDIEVTFVD